MHTNKNFPQRIYKHVICNSTKYFLPEITYFQSNHNLLLFISNRWRKDRTGRITNTSTCIITTTRRMKTKQVRRVRLWRILTTFLPEQPRRPGEQAVPTTEASTAPWRDRAPWSLATMRSYQIEMVIEADNWSKLKTFLMKDYLRILVSHRGIYHSA